MAWYEYRQNNSGGSFDYDPQQGLSIHVYVEAETGVDADVRAERLGIYFDGCDSGMDCHCCGDRWSPAADWREISEENIPAKDEPMIRDDNKRGYHPMRWLEDGEYEAFVHPAKGEFYGAHGKFIHIKREITGYGLHFTENTVGEIIDVGWDGYDVTGNKFFPAPEARQSYSLNPIVVLDSGMRLEKFASTFGSHTSYRLWSPNRSMLEMLQKQMKDYIALRPSFDFESLFERAVPVEGEIAPTAIEKGETK